MPQENTAAYISDLNMMLLGLSRGASFMEEKTMSFQVMLRELTTGFGSTLMIFFLTLLFSLPLGMVVYFGRVSR